MDHKEQHHEHHRHEREQEKKEAHSHQAETGGLRGVYPRWFLVAGVVLVIVAVVLWTVLF
jgi:hypothetical protein